MRDFTTLPHQLDTRRRTCRAIIETPKSSRNKFAYDPETGLFELRHVLPEGMVFPFDFGFIPSTRGEDGDPVDMLVFMDAPTHAGCLIQVRIVGVIAAEQIERGRKVQNDRLLGVAIHSYQYEAIRSVADVGRTVLSQIEDFFISYNRQRGKTFKVKSTSGPRRALQLLQAGTRAYEQDPSA